MPKEIELCTPCAEKMKEGYRLQQLLRPANNKVTCGLCGKRRFGAKYIATKIIRRREKDAVCG